MIVHSRLRSWTLLRQQRPIGVGTGQRRHLHDVYDQRDASTRSDGASSSVTLPSPRDRKSQWHRTSKESTYADSLRVHVKGGQGGDGCVSFAREKFKPFGPPSGSNGGQGGAVQIQASLNVASLARIPGQLNAQRGTHGTSDWQPGKRGPDKVLHVPVGTVVRLVPVQSVEEQDVLRREYEASLRRQYRGAYVRHRHRAMPSLSSTGNGWKYSLEEQRLHRDSVWRYYSGAIGHTVTPSKSSSKMDARLPRDEEAYEDEESDDDYDWDARQGRTVGKTMYTHDLSDAESDIRALGKSFAEAERRLAFTLLDRESELNEAASRSIPAARTDEASPATLPTSPVESSTDGQGWTIDLDREMNEPLLLVQGGHGGMGNTFFASSANRSPTLATRGAMGNEAIVHLEWKFKGDVGLIGLPNAGKSTFLKSVCSTGDNVRVANYAFTTLTPNIGVVRLSNEGLIGTGTGPIEESLSRDISRRTQEGEGLSIDKGENATVSYMREAPRIDERDESSRFILQDLPGLVRGASENRGLGHDFLKHIERCLALYYVVDVSDAAQAPWDDINLVKTELELYRKGLSDKVRGVIANKCDAIDVDQSDSSSPNAKQQEAQAKLNRLRQEVCRSHDRPIEVWNVSAKYRVGVEKVTLAMDRAVREERQKAIAAAAAV